MEVKDNKCYATAKHCQGDLIAREVPLVRCCLAKRKGHSNKFFGLQPPADIMRYDNDLRLPVTLLHLEGSGVVQKLSHLPVKTKGDAPEKQLREACQKYHISPFLFKKLMYCCNSNVFQIHGDYGKAVFANASFLGHRKDSNVSVCVCIDALYVYAKDVILPGQELSLNYCEESLEPDHESHSEHYRIIEE